MSTPAIQGEISSLSLRLTHPFGISRSVHAGYERPLLRLTCDGSEGYGEAAPSERYGETEETVVAAFERLVPLLGDDPYAIERIERDVLAPLDRDASAKAAISMALHDLVARRHGMPLYRWFGLDPDRIPPTSFTIGIDAQDVMLRKLEEAAEYSIVKIKMGFDGDVDVLRSIRAATDRPIRVDANEGWTVERAIALLPVLVELGVELLEQPVPASDVEGLASVAKESEIPVVADESCRTSHDLAGLVGVVDVVNVKIAKCGSLAEARRTMEMARALGFDVFLGCMIESSIGIAAAAHIAPLADYVDLDGHLLLADDPFTGLRLESGTVRPDPDAPGLGVRPID